jgi:hypothetical protein
MASRLTHARERRDGLDRTGRGRRADGHPRTVKPVVDAAVRSVRKRVFAASSLNAEAEARLGTRPILKEHRSSL